jgi:hypothetical protein
MRTFVEKLETESIGVMIYCYTYHRYYLDCWPKTQPGQWLNCLLNNSSNRL